MAVPISATPRLTRPPSQNRYDEGFTEALLGDHAMARGVVGTTVFDMDSVMQQKEKERMRDKIARQEMRDRAEKGKGIEQEDAGRMGDVASGGPMTQGNTSSIYTRQCGTEETTGTERSAMWSAPSTARDKECEKTVEL